MSYPLCLLQSLQNLGLHYLIANCFGNCPIFLPIQLVLPGSDFLTNCNQKVRIKAALSNLINSFSGTPQRSVISSLLLFMRMDDLSSIIEKTKIYLYADQVKVYKFVNSVQDITTCNKISIIFPLDITPSPLKLIKICATINFDPLLTYPLPCLHVLEDSSMANSVIPLLFIHS